MSTLVEKNKLKYNKIWLTKDKYIYRATLGDHWYLKKFIVLYKTFLVNREKIVAETFKDITTNFQTFVSSYANKDIKDDAEQFFFAPVDFRDPKKIIDFEKFNDVADLDDAARKYYIMYLMGVGMQSGIKAAIGKLLHSTKNITISKILREIPKIQQEEIKQKKESGKQPRSVADKPKTIFSDFHAEIRNYRQLLSYFGILPPEEDGYELNEVGKVICAADPLLLMSIWEHQKIKMRYSNPYTRPLHSANPQQEYVVKNDFEDFSVNPYLALLAVLNELRKESPSAAYLTFEDYKYFLCRAAPFNSKEVTRKILEFRHLHEDEKKKIKDIFDQRPKTRTFSKDKPKAPSEDFLKELSNWIYGIADYQYTHGKKDYTPLVRYQNQRLEIINEPAFTQYAEFLEQITQYLEKEYGELYTKISSYCTLKTIDEISKKVTDPTYLTKLTTIREQFIKKDNLNSGDFYENTLNSWKNYISYIDPKILIFIYSAQLAIKIKNIQKPTAQDTARILPTIPKPLRDIVGTDEEELRTLIAASWASFLSKDSNFLKVFANVTLHDTAEDTAQVETWLENALRDNSYAVIKQKINKEEADFAYNIDKGKRLRKRNMKLMLLVRTERVNEHKIMNQYRPNYPVNNCDCCSQTFSKGEPECHHIIPFEIYGPDTAYNYAFLCNKCHKIFTHKTLSVNKQDAIDKLKEHNIIKKEYFEKMIKSGDLQKAHLDFLHREGYIHIVDKLEYLKMIGATKRNEQAIDSFFKKTLPSKDRWTRAMKVVFFYRERFKLIMEQIKDNYTVDCCDSCNTKFTEKEPECHHIVPKAIKGPESPFNYAYLCTKCHSQITHNKPNKNKVITNLQKKGIISATTFYKMLIANEITNTHLTYALQQKLLSEDVVKKLRATQNKINENT